MPKTITEIVEEMNKIHKQARGAKLSSIRKQKIDELVLLQQQKDELLQTA